MPTDRGPDRLITFVDAVVAIAITPLVPPRGGVGRGGAGHRIDRPVNQGNWNRGRVGC